MKILIVTPARNEALNLPRLAASLRFQTKKFEYVWVVVDDNSTDNTSEIFSGLELPFETHSLATKSTGKLISGGAYYTWWKGVDYGLKIHHFLPLLYQCFHSQPKYSRMELVFRKCYLLQSL